MMNGLDINDILNDDPLDGLNLSDTDKQFIRDIIYDAYKYGKTTSAKNPPTVIEVSLGFSIQCLLDVFEKSIPNYIFSPHKTLTRDLLTIPIGDTFSYGKWEYNNGSRTPSIPLKDFIYTQELEVCKILLSYKKLMSTYLSGT